MNSIKNLGILLYIDDHPTMYEDFEWIYKSWIYSGNWRSSDLVAVCHPNALNRIPNDPGITKLTALPLAVPGSKWHGYPFINSIACLASDEVRHAVAKYTWLLRTDADVFLTGNLVNFRPSFPVHGRGLYAYVPEVWEKMVSFCAQHGVNHARVFGCGHSLLGHTGLVLDFISRQRHWCDILFDHFAVNGNGQWPGWCKNVLTMYAAEITANEGHDRFLRHSYQRVLDVECDRSEPIDSLVMHIHAVHTQGYFSKHAYRAGQYANVDRTTLDRTKINQYAHWLVTTPVEEVKSLVGYKA